MSSRHMKGFKSELEDSKTTSEAEKNKAYFKKLGNECFNHLEKTNPNGGIREFIRIGVEFGYKKAEAFHKAELDKLEVEQIIEDGKWGFPNDEPGRFMVSELKDFAQELLNKLKNK